MSLPEVSVETRDKAWKELDVSGTIGEYCEATVHKLCCGRDVSEKRNNIIGRYLWRLAVHGGGGQRSAATVVFGALVYRMLELTIGEEIIPKVLSSTAHKVEAEYWKDPTCYIPRLIERLINENWNVISVVNQIFGLELRRSVHSVKELEDLPLHIGLCVYRMIEVQCEQNGISFQYHGTVH